MTIRLKLLLLAVVPVLATILLLLQNETVSRPALRDALIAGLLVSVILSLRAAYDTRRPLLRLRGAARYLGATEAQEAAAASRSNDELVQLAALFTDITRDVHRATREAQDRRQETDAIFACMADGILVVDTDLRIRRINPAACDLLALSPDRAVGHTVIEATMLHALDGLFRDAMTAGSTQSRRMETLQPSRHVLQALVTPLSGTESPGGAVAVLQNLTEFDRVERVRRDFMTNVSHELRTPVTSIKVMVESLQRGALKQPELAAQFLQSIGDSANRLAQLVDDVLSLARAEAGPGRIEWQPVSLDALVAEVVAAHRPLAEEYGISLRADELDPVTITGDAEGLHQAVANLITNAIKYNRRGGSVEIRLRRTASVIQLQVSDTGIGIAAEHLSRVFERFYRVDQGRSSEMGGTGLGLAIVKHIAEAHGGRVSVASKPDTGSTFTLTFPNTSGAGAQAPKA